MLPKSARSAYPVEKLHSFFNVSHYLVQIFVAASSNAGDARGHCCIVCRHKMRAAIRGGSSREQSLLFSFLGYKRPLGVQFSICKSRSNQGMFQFKQKDVGILKIVTLRLTIVDGIIQNFFYVFSNSSRFILSMTLFVKVLVLGLKATTVRPHSTLSLCPRKT